MALVTKTEVKAYAGISGTTLDTLIDTIIDQVSDYCITKINYNPASATYTEYFDGNGQRTLFVKNIPIQSITSIHYDTERVYGADTLVASTDYCFFADEGIIELDWSREQNWRGAKAIKVVYTGGGTIPNWLKRACILKVCSSLKKDLTQTILVSNATDWEKRAETLSDEADKILSVNRIMSYAKY